jgi:hypothetical protein
MYVSEKRSPSAGLSLWLNSWRRVFAFYNQFVGMKNAALKGGQLHQDVTL